MSLECLKISLQIQIRSLAFVDLLLLTEKCMLDGCPRVLDDLICKQLDKIVSKMFSFGVFFVEFCSAKVKDTTNLLTSAGQ